MYIFLSILGVILAVIIILILVAPLKYHINRSIVINRPLPEVFEYLRYVKNQDHWSPWKKKDPDMKQSFTGEDGTVGFVSSWEGNKDVGSGEQEIVKITENKRLDTELRFFKPWKSESDAYMEVDEVDGGTRVTWGFSGVNKRPYNVMMLFYNMDKAVGKDFEEGLTDLKKILES
ncbi:polyketide cyclase [Pukyongia salina]|uniref:Polyketide cyclase n=1 Tax=Pukyongia salina TaxID=2094025 RepID=A0A2S0I0S9_9FLAO|nr:SRPBCC family protein [Pukyongia salina]AVI52233.1 polyketide cyclase [Pukyongia salina]